MDPDILIPIAGMVTVFGALGWTVRHWLDRHYEHKRGLREVADDDDVTRLHERLAMLEEQVAARVTELEERVDFTERVLTRGRAETESDASGRN
jgi:hypothetical protein